MKKQYINSLILEELKENDFKVLSIVGENNSEDLTFDKIRRYSEKSEVVKFLDTFYRKI